MDKFKAPEVHCTCGHCHDEKEEKHHHHHLICMKCGKVISFQDDLLEGLETKIAETTGFHVVDHEVKLYGYCVECGGNLIEEKSE